MTETDLALMAELLACLVALTEASAKIGLDMRTESAVVVGEACDRLELTARPDWAAPKSGAFALAVRQDQ